MSELRNIDSEHLSRQQAADRVTDLAYVLTVGGPLKLAGGDEVAVPDRVALRVGGRSDDGRVEIALTLSWSAEKSPGISADGSRSPPSAPDATTDQPGG